MKTVCLNMIVRNEANCIARCVESVRPLVSYWVICDTGSSDGTQQIVKEALRGIPGELHQDQWRDFSFNRNLGLERARGKADYHLMLDADFTATITPELSPSEFTEDAYRIAFTGELQWRVTRLVSDQHEWRYYGRAHEYLAAPTARTIADLPGMTFTHHEDGGSRPGRLEKYLELLLADYQEMAGRGGETPALPRNLARTVFYIAQTYVDLGCYEQAVEWYERRLPMDHGGEEQWFAAYMMTRCKQMLGRPWPEVLQGYLECHEMRPWRLEPLQRICEHHRQIKHYELNYLLTYPALGARYPEEDLIFIERPVYRYGLLMERALACYWTQRFGEAADLAERVLKAVGLPEEYRESADKLLKAAEQNHDGSLKDSGAMDVAKG